MVAYRWVDLYVPSFLLSLLEKKLRNKKNGRDVKVKLYTSPPPRVSLPCKHMRRTFSKALTAVVQHDYSSPRTWVVRARNSALLILSHKRRWAEKAGEIRALLLCTSILASGRA